MPYLMHIAFDNSARLRGRVYYFEYRGVRFKLIQNNPRKWSDVLLTLTAQDDRDAQDAAYAAAGEFLSAISWANHSRVALASVGGVGVKTGYTLRQARCRVLTHPRIPFGGCSHGIDLSVIPAIESDAQRRALTLFREAGSSNKVWLSFLFYWQIMEINSNNTVAWVNKVLRKGKVQVRDEEIRCLPLAAQGLGEYFQEDCRHAIAHIRRKPGRAPLRFDVGSEDCRLSVSTAIAKRLAEYYIRAQLNLTKRMDLVRPGGRGFPRYVDRSHLDPRSAVLAYPR